MPPSISASNFRASNSRPEILENDNEDEERRDQFDENVKRSRLVNKIKSRITRDKEPKVGNISVVSIETVSKPEVEEVDEIKQALNLDERKAKERKYKEDKKFEKIVGLRFGTGAAKVETVIGRPETSNVVWSNSIKTTKYTLLTFFPLNLFEQMQSPANIYYVIQAVLQCIPIISDSDGIPTVAFPLAIVMGMKMVIDAFEDYQRFVGDKEENEREVIKIQRNRKIGAGAGPTTESKLVDNKKKTVQWRDLKVGDIIEIQDGDPIPADCLMLWTAAEDDTTYVETKHLDGEANLKAKFAHPKISEIVNEGNFLDQVLNLDARVTYEGPSTQLYEFAGEIQIGGEVHVLECDNLLLRGSSLQGDRAIAVVAYTGKNTRVFRNMNNQEEKKESRLTEWYNRHVIALVLLQITFVLILTLLYVFFNENPKLWYLDFEDVDTVFHIKSFVIVLCRNILLFSYFVPITLVVTLELIRIIEKFFIRKDLHMMSFKSLPDKKDDESDPNLRSAKSGSSILSSFRSKKSKKNAKKTQKSSASEDHDEETGVVVNNSGVIEDLGMVTHIFTDKTGTLTKNLMVFHGYASARYPILATASYVNNEITSLDESTPCSLEFCDGKFPRNYIFQRVMEEAAEKEFAKYVVCLGVAHTVQVREIRGKIKLDAQSPDELALVQGAHAFGLEYLGKPKPDRLEFKVTPRVLKLWNLAHDLNLPESTEKVQIKIKYILPFDNDRKRMSVIVNIPENDKHFLYIKGADNQIFDVSEKATGDAPKNDFTELESALSTFSERGLRTLLLGVRELSAIEVVEFGERWSASKTMTDRDDKKKVENNCIKQMERDIRIVGATGVEDQLQDEVPETLESLQRGGIKVWVLTGDKVETAVNIAKSCRLIQEHTYVNVFTNTDRNQISQSLENLHDYLRNAEFLRNYFEMDWVEEESDDVEKMAKEQQTREGENENVRLDVSQVGSKKHTTIELTGEKANKKKKRRNSLKDGPVGLSIASADFVDQFRPPDLRQSNATMQNHENGSQMGDGIRRRVTGISLVSADGVDTKICVYDKITIVVSGDCLHTILSDTVLRRRFFYIALSSCTSVICCRVTPMQKSLVVLWAQRYLDSHRQAMLAIGDGANDVGMILTARVGVGVKGKEGSQACRSADFAINEFRFLKRLMFVHGREAIRRNSIAMYYISYKSVAYCMVGFFYNFYALWSGNDYFDPMMKQLFNTIYTSLPIFTYCMLDREYPHDILEKTPDLYKQTKYAGPLLGHENLLYWMFLALFAALIYGNLPAMIICTTGINELDDIYSQGYYMYHSMCIHANIILMISTHKAFWLTIFVVVFSLVSFYISWIILDHRVFGHLITEYMTWLIAIFCTFCAIYPHLIYTVHKRQKWNLDAFLQKEYRKFKKQVRLVTDGEDGNRKGLNDRSARKSLIFIRGQSDIAQGFCTDDAVAKFDDLYNESNVNVRAAFVDRKTQPLANYTDPRETEISQALRISDTQDQAVATKNSLILRKPVRPELLHAPGPDSPTHSPQNSPLHSSFSTPTSQFNGTRRSGSVLMRKRLSSQTSVIQSPIHTSSTKEADHRMIASIVAVAAGPVATPVGDTEGVTSPGSSQNENSRRSGSSVPELLPVFTPSATEQDKQMIQSVAEPASEVPVSSTTPDDTVPDEIV